MRSIYGLLGYTGPSMEPKMDAKMEIVRQAMLQVVTSAELGVRHPEIPRRLQHAYSIHALWYVRSDMMTALASEHGETFARQKMLALTDMFEGLLPEARKARKLIKPRKKK